MGTETVIVSTPEVTTVASEGAQGPSAANVLANLPIYADGAAAQVAGLVTNQFYQTSTGALMVV